MGGKAWSLQETAKDRVFALLDEHGPDAMTARGMAEVAGCSRSTAESYRRHWRNRDTMAVHCERCGMRADWDTPIIEGLCLWCWLEQAGRDVRTMCESGAYTAILMRTGGVDENGYAVVR